MTTAERREKLSWYIIQAELRKLTIREVKDLIKILKVKR